MILSACVHQCSGDHRLAYRKWAICLATMFWILFWSFGPILIYCRPKFPDQFKKLGRCCPNGSTTYYKVMLFTTLLINCIFSTHTNAWTVYFMDARSSVAWPLKYIFQSIGWRSPEKYLWIPEHSVLVGLRAGHKSSLYWAWCEIAPLSSGYHRGRFSPLCCILPTTSAIFYLWPWGKFIIPV
jgi:hypothetical protein